MDKRAELNSSELQSWDSKISAVTDQVSSVLNGEAVILHIKTGSYYGLNEIGTRIWNLIEKPQKMSTIRDTILNEYDVEKQQLDADLQVLFNDLFQKGLVEISHEVGA